MEEDFDFQSGMERQLRDEPQNVVQNRTKLEILNVKKAMAQEGIVFIQEEQLDDYASLIYPLLPDPSNLQLYVRNILNQQEDNFTNLIAKTDNNIYPNTSGEKGIFKQNYHYLTNILNENPYIPKARQLSSISRANLRLASRHMTRSQLQHTPVDEFFIDCQVNILANINDSHNNDTTFKTLGLMLLHIAEFNHDLFTLRQQCRSTYDFQVLFGIDHSLSADSNPIELTNRNQLLIARSLPLFQQHQNGIDLESYISILFSSPLNYTDNQDLWEQLRGQKYIYKNKAFLEGELRPQLGEANLSLELQQQYQVLRSSMTNILDHQILYGGCRAMLYLLLIHLQRLFIVLERRQILKREFKEYCYMMFSPLPCLSLYQQNEPSFTKENWLHPTHHILNFQVNACLKVNREIWKFLSSQHILLENVLPYNLSSTQIYSTKKETDIQLLLPHHNSLQSQTGFVSQTHQITTLLRANKQTIQSFQTIVLGNSINHIFEARVQQGQILFQTIDRYVTTQQLNPALVRLLSAFLFQFASVDFQNYALVVVFLVYKLSIDQTHLNQQYLTISETISLEPSLTLESFTTLTKRLLNSLVIDALEAYHEYQDETNENLFETTLKISKASAYILRTQTSERGQFNQKRKLRQQQDDDFNHRQRMREQQLTQTLSQVQQQERAREQGQLSQLAGTFGYDHDLSNQFADLKLLDYVENGEAACGIQVLRYFYQKVKGEQMDIQTFMLKFDLEEFEDSELFDLYWKQLFSSRVRYGVFIPKIAKWYNSDCQFQIVWDAVQSHIFPSDSHHISKYIEYMKSINNVEKPKRKGPWQTPIYKLEKIPFVKQQKYTPGISFEDRGCLLTNVYFDIETYLTSGGEHIPYLLCAYNKTNNQYSRFLSFDDPELVTFAFINQIYRYLIDESAKTKKKCIMNVWSFNGAKFDVVLILKVLYQQFQHFEFQIMGTINNIKTLYVNLTSQCSVVFYDFILLSPLGSLREQCEFYQVKNKKGDLKISDYTDISKIKENINEIIEYCCLDCLSLCECHCKYIEKLQGFGLDFPQRFNIKPLLMSGTISQLSLKFYQNCFLNTLVEGTCSSSIYEAEISSYYGGCTQVFQYGEIKTQLSYVDINSMYPFIMRNFAMPIRAQEISLFELDERALDSGTISDNALYLVDEFQFLATHKPNLPVRTKTGLIYPVNSKTPSWRWGCELNINKYRLKLKISAILYYPGEINLFQPYVDYLYTKRKTSKCEIEKKLLKLLMNNLYGKFAQKPLDHLGICSENLLHLYNKDEDDAIPEEDIQTLISDAFKANTKTKVFEQLSRIKEISPLKDGICMIKTYRNQADYRFVGSLVRLSSYITAQARCHLFKFINRLPTESVKYCDTDCLFMEAKDLHLVQNELGNELGQFKDELNGETIISSQFFAPKYYTYTTDKGKIVQKLKGINMKTANSMPELFDGSIYNDCILAGRQSKIGVPQTQWKRTKLSVFTTSIIKELVLIPRRYVTTNGRTIPFADEAAYIGHRGKNIYQDEFKNFYYK